MLLWQRRERHFLSQHKKFNFDYPPRSEVRKTNFQDLEAQKHNSLFARSVFQSQEAVQAIFCIANILVKYKKHLQGGKMVKQAFLDAGNVFLIN
jgi:hypothetical protein